MTIPRLIAVIDIGKTNAKLVLIDSQSQTQIASTSTPNNVRHDGLYPHADVDNLWQFITQGLAAFHATHGVDGISITTHGATAALLAGDELALPVLDYEHDGPQTSAPAYMAIRPDFAETLSPRLPNGLNLGAQLFWQSHSFSGQFAKVTRILTYPQYWAWRLTGIAASEVTSLGCHTDLWAPEEGRFSSLVENQRWTTLFPPIRPAAWVLGTITPQVAAQTGLAPSTPVACGIHDSNASLIPHLEAREAPFTVISSGTWAIAMTVGGSTTALDAARDSLANVDAYGRPVPTARFMGGREFDLLVPEPSDPSSGDIARVIAQGFQALPSFVPGVGPFPDARGRWTGDPDSLTAGERTAAVTLYLSLMTEACLELCGLGREIIVEGALARNRLFGDALARLTGVPVASSRDATGTSLGASLLFGGAYAPKNTALSNIALNVDGFDAYRDTWRSRL